MRREREVYQSIERRRARAGKRVRAIQFDRFGGPEVLEYREVRLAEPGAGQARVKHTAVGVNFIDVYQDRPLSAGAAGSLAMKPRASSSRPARASHVSPDRLRTRRRLARLLLRAARRRALARETARSTIANGDDAQGPHGVVLLVAATRSSAAIRFCSTPRPAASVIAAHGRNLGANVIGIVSTEGKRARVGGCEHVLLRAMHSRVRRSRTVAACRSRGDSARRSFNRSTADAASA
jgi:NADPH2:quinone reductase